MFANLSHLNNIIAKSYCGKIENRLMGISYDPKSKSVKAKVDAINKILDKYDIDNKSALIADLAPMLVSTGLKSHKRGAMFNDIVYEHIRDSLDLERFQVEKEVNVSEMSERLDFRVVDTVTGKSLYGFNQLDLWSGGHQINRADKYVISDAIHNVVPASTKLICVVHNKVVIKTTRSKTYKIFSKGFETERLFYVKQLPSFFESYFNFSD